jgi:LPS export ABC transporter protein LptC
MRPPAQLQDTLKRRLVTVSAFAAGLALVYGIFGAPDESDIAAGAAGEDRGYFVRDATLTEMGVDGTPRIVLRSRSIEQQLSDQSVLLEDLELDYKSTDAGTWRVTAERGRMPPDHGSLLLSGDVTVTGTEARGTAIIRTDNLAYDTTSGLVQTADPVAIRFGPHELNGRGLRLVLNEGTLRLESNVHGRFNP